MTSKGNNSVNREYDPNYEFHAPMFIDFTEIRTDDNADEWFSNKRASHNPTTKKSTVSLLDMAENEFVPKESNHKVDKASQRELKNYETEAPLSVTKQNEMDTSESKNNKRKAVADSNDEPSTKKRRTSRKSNIIAPNNIRRFTQSSLGSKFKSRKSSVLRTSLLRKNRRKSKLLNRKAEYLPVRSVAPLTEPQEFKFQTAKRPRAIQKENQESEVHEEKLNQNLVASSSSSTVAQASVTVPKPFTFRSDARAEIRKLGNENEQTPHSPFVSLAAKVYQFYNKTPARFHRKRKDEPIPAPVPPPPLTKPVEFQLATALRSRPPTMLSTIEREELEMSQIPKFKALPLDRKILESSGDIGVPRVDKLPLTEPVSFQFATDLRAGARSKSSSVVDNEESHSKPFKALKLDEKILKEAPKLPEIIPSKATIPQSPLLQTKLRSQSRATLPQPEETFVFKARSIPPSLKKPFQPKFDLQIPLTDPQPFDLLTEKRGAAYLSKFKDELDKDKQEQDRLRTFKANPMPINSPMIPKHYEVPPTISEPFKLETEKRGVVAVERFAAAVDKEVQETLTKINSFKARPIPKSEPFMVKKSTQPLTEISDFMLNTDRRSVERRAFELKKAEQERQLMELKMNQEKERQEEEQKEILELRKKLVFKAQPILKTKPMEIKPSQEKLTEPQSPFLLTKKRYHLRLHDL